MTKNNTPTSEDELEQILERLIRPIVGSPCETKDTDDFPELHDVLDEDGRCLTCLAYEKTEEAKAAIQALLHKEVLELLPEYRDNTDSKEPTHLYIDFISVGFNQAIDTIKQNAERKFK